MDVLAETGALCLLGWVDTSLAAGCHMQVRTVLGSKSSWENELVFDRSAAPVVQLPPILAKPPCHDQVPHVVDSIGARISGGLSARGALTVRCSQTWYSLISSPSPFGRHSCVSIGRPGPPSLMPRANGGLDHRLHLELFGFRRTGSSRPECEVLASFRPPGIRSRFFTA